MKIYVLDELFYYYKSKHKTLGEDFLENQLHFLTLKEAIEYGNLFIRNNKAKLNTENVEYIGYEISVCEITDNIGDEELYVLIHNHYIDGAEFITSKVLKSKKVKSTNDITIEDLLLDCYDSHEAVGFNLAIAYMKNPKQDFTKLRKEIYNKNKE